MRSILIVMLSLLLLSCGNTENQVEDSNALIPANGGRYYGGTFHLNETEYLKTLFPPSITDAVSSRMASLFYEGLFRFDQSTLEVIPQIVESYIVDSTSTVYTFKLKDSVYFHHNPLLFGDKKRRLISEDVRFCIENLLSKKPYISGSDVLLGIVKGSNKFYENSADETFEGSLEGFKKIDDLSFQIILEKPDAHFLQRLATPQLLIYSPESYYKNGLDMAKNPSGTGAFMLESFNEGSQYILKKNPDYYAEDQFSNQLPFLDNIVVRFIQNKKTAFSIFKEGNLDMLYRLPKNYHKDVLEENYEDRAGPLSKYILQQSPEMMTQIMGFNTQSLLFSDMFFRKAIAFSIDRDHILDNILNGEGFAPGHNGITPPCFEKYNSESLSGYIYNPDSAKYYFDKSKVKRLALDTKIKLWLNSDGQRNTHVAVYISEKLQDVLGLNIELEIVPFSILQEKILDGSAQFYRIGWLADIPSPKSFLDIFYGKHLKKESVYPNIFRYQNKAFDLLYELAGQTYDLEKANKLYLSAEKVVIEDSPFIVLWYDEGYRLLQPYVKNFPNNPMQYRNFNEVYFESPETLAHSNL